MDADPVEPAPPPPLSNQDLARLSPDHPDRASDPAPVQLERGSLRSASLADPSWEKATLRDVWLVESTVTGGHLRELRFEDGRLERVEIRAAKLADVTFVGVSFVDVGLIDTELEGCRFERCHLSGMRWARARLRGCTFEDCVLAGLEAEEVEIGAVVLVRCRAAALRWVRVTIAGMRWTGGEIGLTAWTSCDSDRAQIEGVTLNQLDILGGKHRRTTFSRADGGGLVVADADLSEWTLDEGCKLTDVRICRVRCDRLHVNPGCTLTGLTVIASLLGRVQVRGSELIHTVFDEVDVGQHMELVDVGIGGICFRDSTMHGVSFTNAQLRGYITAVDSRFRSMRGTGVIIEPGIERALHGVTYSGSSFTFEDDHGAASL